MENEKKNVYVPGTYISPFVVALATGVNSIFCGCTSEELQLTRNPAIDVGADCLGARRRNLEADSAAPWQRAPPLDNVQVAAVRAAWHES